MGKITVTPCDIEGLYVIEPSCPLTPVTKTLITPPLWFTYKNPGRFCDLDHSFGCHLLSYKVFKF